MAVHSQATTALLFMQQCRIGLRRTNPSIAQFYRQASSSSDDGSSQYSPENYGKKYSYTMPHAPRMPWRRTQTVIRPGETRPNNIVGETSLPSPSDPSTWKSEEFLPLPSSSSSASASTSPLPPPPSTSIYDNALSSREGGNHVHPPRQAFRQRYNPANYGLRGFIKRVVLRIPEPPPPDKTVKEGLAIYNNPYRVKKQWPPDVTQMSELQQFYYEKTYRRRALNKAYSRRVNLNKYTLLVQRLSAAFLILYFAFVFDAVEGEMGNGAAEDFRYFFYGKLRNIGREVDGQGDGAWPDGMQIWLDSQWKYYMRKHKRRFDEYNHEGWDDTRPIDSLPGRPTPPIQNPLPPPI